MNPAFRAGTASLPDVGVKLHCFLPPGNIPERELSQLADDSGV
jgi:hypothetical protein